MSGSDKLRDSVLSTLGRARGGGVDIAGCFFVPGRIEVLGKHTDYAGGRSLVAAVERGFVIAAARRDDGTVRVIDSVSGESVEARPDGGADARAPRWATYPLTVLRRCALDFPAADGGADLVFASDLPPAAGLSSSSALVVATFLALDAVRGTSHTAEYRAAIDSTDDLAGYLGAVENGLGFRSLPGDSGVGTMGGSEDHTAILCARAGHLVQYSYAPVRHEGEVLLPEGWTFAVGTSGVRAEKTGAARVCYNELSAATQRLAGLWRRATGGREATLADIIANHPDAPLRLREIVRRADPGGADALLARLGQFIAESETIVPGARTSLERGDIDGFARFTARSQQLAEHALRNQTPETVHLVERAVAMGAAASSAFGAGFGGSVWALVRDAEAHEFARRWRAAYVARFSNHRADADFFITPPGAPARQLRDVP